MDLTPLDLHLDRLWTDSMGRPLPWVTAAGLSMEPASVLAEDQRQATNSPVASQRPSEHWGKVFRLAPQGA